MAKKRGKRLCWLLWVQVRQDADFRVLHLLKKIGARPSKFRAGQYVSAYAPDCRGQLNRHMARLAAAGLKPRAQRVRDWLPPRDPANPIERAIARYDEALAQGKVPHSRMPSEPRHAMSPVEFARQWLAANAAAPQGPAP
jgi:hypothetical protein